MRDDARYLTLSESGILGGVRKIAAYAAMAGEPDPLPWRHVTDGRQVALPRVVGRDLSFHMVRGPEDLAPGRWGILEPAGGEAVELEDLDLVLVPLLAFDYGCGRVGRGGGFYDRALAGVAGRPLGTRPGLVGIADGEDELPSVPRREWDVVLDMVATPERIHRR